MLLLYISLKNRKTATSSKLTNFTFYKPPESLVPPGVNNWINNRIAKRWIDKWQFRPKGHFLALLLVKILTTSNYIQSGYNMWTPQHPKASHSYHYNLYSFIFAGCFYTSIRFAEKYSLEASYAWFILFFTLWFTYGDSQSVIRNFWELISRSVLEGGNCFDSMIKNDRIQ